MDLISIRKHLHRHPELSGKEISTAEFVERQLRECAPHAVLANLGSTGVTATFKSKTKGKHILLRCELDGLPISETNRFEYKSIYPGVSHKCGHDGHMTILLGVAKHFAGTALKKGTLTLLFQPSEENGKGARSVLKDKRFSDNIKPDFVFALHNVPGVPKHHIICKSGVFTPSVISLKIKLIGKTAHAAEPQNGVNPAFAVSEIIQAYTDLQNSNPADEHFSVIALVETVLGTPAYGISAGYGEMGFTLRTWANSRMKKLKSELLELIKNKAEKHGLKWDFEWFEEFQPIENNPSAVALVEAAAVKSGFPFAIQNHPFTWGEDFGLFTQKYRGAMFALGAGVKSPALHNPDYDFPDDLIKTGVRLFVEIINQAQE